MFPKGSEFNSVKLGSELLIKYPTAFSCDRDVYYVLVFGKLFISTFLYPKPDFPKLKMKELISHKLN